MISSTQTSSLDDHLNESSLTENEGRGVDTHHTADRCEHNAFLKCFCQDDNEQTKNSCENQSQSGLPASQQSRQNLGQHSWEDEFLHSTLQHFDSLDKESKTHRQIYDYILDEEIEFIQELTTSNIDKLFKQIDESQLQELRKTLPLYQFRTDLIQTIHDHQVLLIQGELGSGKTTQLTQYLYEETYSETPADQDKEIPSQDTKSKTKIKMMIGRTQPRHIATVSAAARLAKEMNVKLDDEVGYSKRFKDCLSDQTNH